MKRLLLLPLTCLLSHALAQNPGAPTIAAPLPIEQAPNTVNNPTTTSAETPQTAQTPQGTPKISSPAPTYEFGSIDNREKVVHSFTIRNDGDGVLNIDRVKAACGCTTPELEIKTLNPGESTEIKATLDLKGKRGLQNKTITVHTNDPETPQFKLAFKGTATSIFGISPTSLSLGRLQPGQTVTKTVTLSNNSDGPINITKVEAQNNLVSYKLRTIEEGKQWAVDVTNTSSVPPGRLNDYIVITTDMEGMKTHRVGVFGTILDKLTISPNPLIISEAAAPGAKSISIRPGTVKEFRVLDAWWPGVKAKRTIKDQGAAGFNVTFADVPNTKEVDKTTIKIMTDIDNEIFDVKVQWRPKPKTKATKPAPTRIPPKPRTPSVLPGSNNPAPLITPGIPNPNLR